MIHTVNSVIVFFIAKFAISCRLRTRSAHADHPERRVLIAATLATLIFALHPIQIEAVTWITGLRDLLGGFGILVATSLYLQAAGRWRFVIASWLAFIFAMLCKPSTVAFPAALFGLIWMQNGGITWARVGRLFPWFLSIVPTILVTTAAQTEIADRELAQINFWQRILVTLDSYAFYIKKWALPIGLTNDYGRKPSVALADPQLIFSCLLIVALLIVLMIFRKKLGGPFLSWCMFAAAMALPTSGIVTFPFQHTSTVTDHYFYLCAAGISIASGLLISSVNSNLLNICSVMVLISYVFLDLKQLPRWQSDSAMFPAMVAANPNSYAGYTGMAAIAMKDKRRLDALQYLQSAQRIDPDKVDLLANKGLVLNELGRYEDVITELGRVLPARSIIVDSPVSAPSVSIYYMMIAYAHIRLDQIEQSLPYICRAQLADPSNSDVVGFMPLVMKHLGHQPFDPNVCPNLKAIKEW